MRNNCDSAYLLTNKEDEARTIDIMRMLLTLGFDPINGSSVLNKPLLKQKSVKAVVRKLLHEVVKLSSVPIDPNLPPPVIKKPPPKVKQPPPTPKRRVGRDDVEMKRGDWLCPKYVLGISVIYLQYYIKKFVLPPKCMSSSSESSCSKLFFYQFIMFATPCGPGELFLVDKPLIGIINSLLDIFAVSPFGS